jgi:hypothetical protein
MGFDRLPVQAGPVPDRLTIWPVDDGRYGLDATFQGASGYERAEHHREDLDRRGVPHSFRQELDGGCKRSGGRRAFVEGSCWLQGILRCAARGAQGGDRA